MKAVIFEKYGPPEVLKLTELKKPAPKDDEVLIKILATSVTTGDTKVRRLKLAGLIWAIARLSGWKKPLNKVLGMEFAGEIEAVGKNVTKFRTGDNVFGDANFNGFGAYAEYKCLPESGMLSIMPSNVSFQQAAVIPVGGVVALRYLKKAKISTGQETLIYGASGSVGTYAIQLAKYFGADVTGVCSTTNLELVKNIGADVVIDYKNEDFSKNDKKYDLIFDAVGKIPRSKRKVSLKQNGKFISAMGNPGPATPDDLIFLKRSCRKGNHKTDY